MKYIVQISKHIISILAFLLILGIFLIAAFLLKTSGVFLNGLMNDEIQDMINSYFIQRSDAFLCGDVEILKDKFDLTSKYGQWSYEHEFKRINFIKNWCKARDLKLEECETKFKIFSIKTSINSAKLYLNEITRMTYVYNCQNDAPVNEFSIGTWHTTNLVKKNDKWYITADWYSDPLEDTIVPSIQPASIDYSEIQTSSEIWIKYNRAKAVEYADKYCGANFYIEDGFRYNKKYRNYSNMGGDCANFASQVLSDKDAGGIRMGGGWLYKDGEASASWINAEKFTYEMLYSGRAKLVARGKYEKVIKFTNTISPGDIIAYAKKGDIVHVSVVTAKDSMGVPLVNSHTSDRYHVPWDLGWNSGDVIFWLLKING